MCMSSFTFTQAAGLLAGVTRFSAAANATGVNELLSGLPPSESAALYHLPNGLQALFNAAVKQEGLNVQLSTPVSNVTEMGQVTLQNGTQLNFDAVVVTVRPPSVTALVPQQLRSVFANATTGWRDVWIFNATLLPSLDAMFRQTMLGMFTLGVTVNGSLGPNTGYPTYVVRLYEDTPYVAVGGYVTPDVSQDSSTATATEAMQQFGLKAESVVAYRRIA